jgi:hypothetical protein
MPNLIYMGVFGVIRHEHKYFIERISQIIPIVPLPPQNTMPSILVTIEAGIHALALAWDMTTVRARCGRRWVGGAMLTPLAIGATTGCAGGAMGGVIDGESDGVTNEATEEAIDEAIDNGEMQSRC